MSGDNRKTSQALGKRRRKRNIFLGLSLFALAVMFYVVTALRLGGQ